jgi:hypothetical protein
MKWRDTGLDAEGRGLRTILRQKGAEGVARLLRQNREHLGASKIVAERFGLAQSILHRARKRGVVIAHRPPGSTEYLFPFEQFGTGGALRGWPRALVSAVGNGAPSLHFLYTKRLSLAGRSFAEALRARDSGKITGALRAAIDRLAFDKPKRRGEGRATSEEGRRALLNAEGGCVSVAEACVLLRKRRPATRRTFMAAIREGVVIAYHRGGAHYSVPVWQFRRGGGLLEVLPEVLRALRTKVPGYGQLSPFAFFLQADSVTAGRTPLSALRDGETQKVLDAVEARIC